MNFMNTSTTPTAKDKLEQARERVQTVMRAVTINEGRVLDFETADGINRTLSNALRDLEVVTINVAIMQRGQYSTR